jgi:SAM-dependent methyltransferase
MRESFPTGNLPADRFTGTATFAATLAAEEHPLDRLRRAVAARRAIRALHRDLATRLAAAARIAASSLRRPCPVCAIDAAEPTPAFPGPVHPFHACTGCGLLYTPLVLRPEIVRAHSREALWEHERAEALAAPPDAFRPLVARLLAESDGRDLAVEVSCGFGRLLAALRPHFGEVLGLERNQRTARAAAATWGVPVRTELLEDLNLPAGSVDLIIMNHLLEHVNDARPLLGAARRLLKPTGALWISLPHGRSLGLRLLGGAHPTILMPTHVNLFSREALARLAEVTGFVPRRLATDDAVDLGVVELAPDLAAAPMLLVDKALRSACARTRAPSLLALGAHLEAVLVPA